MYEFRSDVTDNLNEQLEGSGPTTSNNVAH